MLWLGFLPMSLQCSATVLVVRQRECLTRLSYLHFSILLFDVIMLSKAFHESSFRGHSRASSFSVISTVS